MTKRLTRTQLFVLLAVVNSEPEQRYEYAVIKKIRIITGIGLTRETVHSSLNRLVALGWINLDPEQSQTSSGRPCQRFVFSDEKLTRAAIDEELQLHQQDIAQATQHLADLRETARIYQQLSDDVDHP